MNITTYKRHEFTKATIQYDIKDLVKSIEKDGQLVPALLWWDETTKEWILVDGWHRQKACKKLGTELKTTKLPKDTEEYKIPEMILDIQIHNKMCAKLQATCAAVVYLDMVEEFPRNQKLSQRDLAEKSDKIIRTNISYLRYIKKEKPEWFLELSKGKKVDTQLHGEKYITDSPETIKKHINLQKKLDKSKEALADNTHPRKAGDPKLAQAFVIADNSVKTINDIANTINNEDHKAYLLKETGSKISNLGRVIESKLSDTWIEENRKNSEI